MSGRRQDEGGWDEDSDPQGIEHLGVSEAGAGVEGPASESVRPSGFALGGGPGVRRRRGRPGGLEHEGRSSRSDLGTLTASQRLLILDRWARSGLTAGEFAPLVGVSAHTLYEWKQRFERLGPAGLEPRPRGAPAGQPAAGAHEAGDPDAEGGASGVGLRADQRCCCAARLCGERRAMARVLHEAGYVAVEEPTAPHAPVARRFERARPNQLWQTDLFTFVLKRQNRRVYLVAFMDDHSRFIVGYGLHAQPSTPLVLEVLGAAIANFGRAGGDADRQRPAVRHLAREEPVHASSWRSAGSGRSWRKPQRPADAGQDRALLGHAVAGVPGDGGLPRTGRCAAADRPVHRPLQLPASAPGDRRPGAGRSLLRRRRRRCWRRCRRAVAANALGAGRARRAAQERST